jgi:hypothetical protein
MSDRLTKLRRWSLAHPVIAILLVVTGVAAAAITVTYTTSSTFSTSVTDPPIQFLAGDDASPLTDYVTAFSVSTNKTYMTTTVLGVPESTLTVGELFKIENTDDEAHTVTLSTAQVSNANVDTYTIEIRDTADDSLIDTMDLEAASPDATLPMAADDVFYGKVTLKLNSGAGADNVDLSNAVSLTFA